ncbi:GNAT family N-acetyltransferase [Hathewaya histolytica]|uniref:N-acetyltransferase GCN5 n=1 Tax=Hathewaya histolytica TaxID=1498 RepID=A0A4U9R9Y5_HATHI|nr:GNAT family N-acetyltransferase [Hathewaya histolytica]VTQ88249.1 N-acetyltransferase GCN5 [Hathewaya histolytica]
MYIRGYERSDEQSWIRCRVVSFMDSSYFDYVQNFREEYNNPALRLIAIDNNQVIGFLDIEYEENLGDVCYFEGDLGGVMWNLGVLPEYRHKNVATNLWCKAKSILKDLGIKRVEVWTQDDKASNRWYIKQGFKLKKT